MAAGIDPTGVYQKLLNASRATPDAPPDQGVKLPVDGYAGRTFGKRIGNAASGFMGTVKTGWALGSAGGALIGDSIGLHRNLLGKGFVGLAGVVGTIVSAPIGACVGLVEFFNNGFG